MVRDLKHGCTLLIIVTQRQYTHSRNLNEGIFLWVWLRDSVRCYEAVGRGVGIWMCEWDYESVSDFMGCVEVKTK